ncbi:hypothetical protein NQZ68_019318, partial [Dissostichus eleginoides]
RRSPEQRVMAVLQNTSNEDSQRVVLGKRKRGEEHLTVLREMHSADLAQQERHLQLAV